MKNIVSLLAGLLIIIMVGAAYGGRESLPAVYFLLDAAAPVTIEGPGVSGITATAATLSATINEPGTGYCLVQAAVKPAPSAVEVLAGTAFVMTGGVAATLDITGLAAATAYRINFIARDRSGNTQTAVQSAEFTTDSGIPPATIDGPRVTGTTASATTLSATIDENGTGYFRLQPATDPEPSAAEVLAGTALTMSGGIATMKDITGLAAGTSYTIYFLARDTAGNTQTTIQSVAFTTDSGIPPTTTDGPRVFETTANETTFTATIDEDGTGYYLIRTAAESVPAKEEVLAGNPLAMSAALPVTRNLTGLAAATAYRVSFIAKDTVGNTQVEVQSVEFATDSGIAPTTTDGPRVYGTTETGTTLAAAINEDGTGYFVVKGAAEGPAGMEELMNGTAFAMVADTLATQGITGLSAANDYTLSFLARDTVGNTQDTVQTVNFTTSADSTPPATTAGPSISATTASGTTLAATIDENGTGYYLVRLATELEPTPAEVLSGTSFAMSGGIAATQDITGLTAATDYRISFIARDTAGNSQAAVQSVVFTTDTGIAPTTIAGPSVSGTTAATTILVATIDEEGTGYYLLRPATDPEPTPAEVLTGTPFAMVANIETTKNITNLAAATDYRIYFLARDTAGNTQAAVQSVAFTTDAALKNILFAHGLNDNKGRWDAFAAYGEARGWTVYRTNVARRGSIAARAEELRDYINSRSPAIPDNSLVVVGHSMGGLDLHYLISMGHDDPASDWGQAAATISRYYTIASPHKGNNFAGMDLSVLELIADLDDIDWVDMASSDAVHDLGMTQMQQFNDDYPYSTFSINGRRIPAMALRFSCVDTTQPRPDYDNSDYSDGVVTLESQSLNGAPHSETVFIGAHMANACLPNFPELETEQTSAILQRILDDDPLASETHDIVFYEGNNCTQGEKGIISGDSNRTLHCAPAFPDDTHVDRCDDDEIRSIRLFPGVRKNLSIYLYDQDIDTPGAYSDDWAVIHTGSQNLAEPVCINTFEQQVDDLHGISMYFHKGPTGLDGYRLDGKISKITLADAPRERIVLYEGDNCTQDVVGYFDTSGETHQQCDVYSGTGTCENDEIRSALVFPGVADNTIMKVYDSPTGSLSKDWFYLNRGSKDLTVPFCVNGLEHSTSDREAAAGFTSFYRDDNVFNSNLNGSVSYVKISQSQDATLVFYEGDNCTQQVQGLFEAGGPDNDHHVRCDNYTGEGTCENDDIRSLLIQPGVLKGKDLRVYDDPAGTLNDDYTSIYRGWKTLAAPFCINGFEHDTSAREQEAGITVNNHYQNGLNGKISYIKIIDDL